MADDRPAAPDSTRPTTRRPAERTRRRLSRRRLVGGAAAALSAHHAHRAAARAQRPRDPNSIVIGALRDAKTIDRAQRIRGARFRAWPRFISSDEPLDDGDVVGTLHRKPTVLRPQHRAVPVEEQTVRHDLESEPPAENAVLIDHRRERRARGLDVRPRRVRPRMVDRNRNQLEVIAAMRLVESLPPGQLFPATSPRRPHEKERPLAPRLRQRYLAAIKTRQRNLEFRIRLRGLRNHRISSLRPGSSRRLAVTRRKQLTNLTHQSRSAPRS